VVAYVPLYQPLHFNFTRNARGLPTSKDDWACLAAPRAPLPNLDGVVACLVRMLKAANDVVTAKDGEGGDQPPSNGAVDIAVFVRGYPAPVLVGGR
jgi:hypothetical protein